jgi:hypothetical protein
MALIIRDNFYTATALHTGEKKQSESGYIHRPETKTRTQHRNNCMAKKKDVSNVRINAR